LNEEELKRYNRQMMMEGWGEETQEKIKNPTAFVAGAGEGQYTRDADKNYTVSLFVEEP